MNDCITTTKQSTTKPCAYLLGYTVQQLLKNIVIGDKELFADVISAEVYRQMQPLRRQPQEKDHEIGVLRQHIEDQKFKLDELEQHGRRDSLRVADIPENKDQDDTDAAMMNVCQLMKLEPPIAPKDIAVSHRVGKKVEGKDRQIIVKFATRNIRERVFSAKSKLKEVNSNRTDNGDDDNNDNSNNHKIYINEDLTTLRASLAREARSCKNAGLITDTWTIYGKVLVKDHYNRVSVISRPSDLFKYKTQSNRS